MQTAKQPQPSKRPSPWARVPRPSRCLLGLALSSWTATEPPVASAAEATVFEDDFERPDGPVDGWTVYQGQWAIEGGRLRARADGTDGWAWAGDPAYVFATAGQRTVRLTVGAEETGTDSKEATVEVLQPGAGFHRGDANGDGLLDIADPVLVLHYLFLLERAPPCLDAADSNDDGLLNIADPVHALEFLFLEGRSPPPPGPPPSPCGPDPEGGVLGCEAYEPCQ